MFGKKYLKLPKYYRGFRAVSVIFRCGGVLYFSLTFRYFFFRSSVIQRYFFYRHETKTTKDCADRRVSLDLKILFSSRDSFHENHACTRFSHVAAVTPLQLRITMTRSHALRRHHGRLAFGFRRSARRPYGRHGREDRCCCRQPCRPGEESSGSTEIAFVVLQISGCRMRPARGAGCRPQFAAQVAKGWAAGSFVSCAAREPPRAPTACHLGVHDRQFWVDRTNFDFCRFLAAE